MRTTTEGGFSYSLCFELLSVSCPLRLSPLSFISHHGVRSNLAQHYFLLFFSSSNLQRREKSTDQAVKKGERESVVCVCVGIERGESANEQFMNEDEEGCLLFRLPSSLILWPASSFADAPDSNGILCGPDRWLILSFNQNRPTRTS